MATRFRNPANGYEEEVPDLAWLWVLLFGGVYFAVKGVWRHAGYSFLLVLVTLGLSAFVYPFYARDILRTHYLRRGWREARPGRSRRRRRDEDGDEVYPRRGGGARSAGPSAVLIVSTILTVFFLLVAYVVVDRVREKRRQAREAEQAALSRDPAPGSAPRTPATPPGKAVPAPPAPAPIKADPAPAPAPPANGVTGTPAGDGTAPSAGLAGRWTRETEGLTEVWTVRFADGK